MFASGIVPRFAGVYQVVALKDGNRDSKQEERIFNKLKAFDQDEFHKVAENLHHVERKSGAATAYDPTRSFLFTQLNGKLTVFTGVDAQGLSVYCPSVIVYQPHQDPKRLESLNDKDLVGHVSSKNPVNPEDATVAQYLQDFEVQPMEVDYHSFKDIKQIKKQRKKHEEEMSALLRTHSERAVRPTLLDTSRPVPRRSYSLKFTAPDSSHSPQKSPVSPGDALHRVYSDSLEAYARRHASDPSTPQ